MFPKIIHNSLPILPYSDLFYFLKNALAIICLDISSRESFQKDNLLFIQRNNILLKQNSTIV